MLGIGKKGALVLVTVAFVLSLAGHASSFHGTWVSETGSAVFHDDNRGPIPYEKCGITLVLQQLPDRLAVQFLGVDCKITDDLPFSHELEKIEFEIRGNSLLDNGRKVGTITDQLISFDYADIDRVNESELKLSWSYRNNLFPGFEVDGFAHL